MSNPMFVWPFSWKASREVIASVSSMPAVSARVRGTNSSASANLANPYCSSPGMRWASLLSKRESSTSKAPAPATARGSRAMHLYTFTASSTARSTSSITFLVAPLSRMVAIRDDAGLVSKNVILVLLTSRMYTASADPSSSGMGFPTRTSGIARVATQIRRRSYLDWVTSARSLYFSTKCRTMSDRLCPDTTTLAPESAILLTNCSISFSSVSE
mmetsp:Transcript_11884/g.33491  ORF Transcript_11884/g.33491 Transcript_11884/m.33491 type:complete len:215 (+) Transcript_11884:775-1419(+)